MLNTERPCNNAASAGFDLSEWGPYTAIHNGQFTVVLSNHLLNSGVLKKQRTIAYSNYEG